MIEPIVLVGGGGHCKACIDVMETSGYTIAGVLDKEGTSDILGYKVIGNDEEIEILAHKGFSFVISLGQIKTATVRRKLYEKIKAVNGKVDTVIAASAIISKHSTIGEGTIVMHNAIINAATRVGNNCIINNNALIEHDCIIGAHVHISTAAVINGGCSIGSEVFVGSNSVVAQGISIVDNVIIGAGSVIIQNITLAGVYAGNPARRIDHE